MIFIDIYTSIIEYSLLFSIIWALLLLWSALCCRYSHNCIDFIYFTYCDFGAFQDSALMQGEYNMPKLYYIILNVFV